MLSVLSHGMNAKVAIPVWDGRVSPVMDTAQCLLVVRLQDGHEVARETVTVPPGHFASGAAFISSLNIDVLICGAISCRFEEALRSGDIKVQPWHCGEAEDVLAAFVRGDIENEGFRLPGCGRGRRRGGTGGRCRVRGGAGQRRQNMRSKDENSGFGSRKRTDKQR